MFRAYVIVAFALYIAISVGQGVDEKVVRIYNDMNSNGDDFLYKDEVYIFFYYMSSPPGSPLIYRSFDYSWWTLYGDSPQVTGYFFNKWDVDNNQLLEASDLDVMFDAIDNITSITPGWIQYDWEFVPYFVGVRLPFNCIKE